MAILFHTSISISAHVHVCGNGGFKKIWAVPGRAHYRGMREMALKRNNNTMDTQQSTKRLRNEYEMGTFFGG